MSNIRTVRVKQSIGKTMIPHVRDIADEMQNTKNVIEEMFSRFQSKHNDNIKDSVLESLSNYRHCPSKYCVYDGSYVRFIRLNSDPLKMSLNSGGFVLDDNGWSVKVKQNLDWITSIRKSNALVFVKLTTNDVIRSIS